MNITNKTNPLNQRGIIFSTDAVISFVIALITTLIFVTYLSNTVFSEKQNIEQLELDEKAIFLIDSMVKNQNLDNAILGACNYDSAKKRVLTNNLNYIQIKTNSKPLLIGNYFVKNIAITFTNTNQKENINLSENNSTNCTTIKRFALVDGQNAIIEMKVCKMK